MTTGTWHLCSGKGALSRCLGVCCLASVTDFIIVCLSFPSCKMEMILRSDWRSLDKKHDVFQVTTCWTRRRSRHLGDLCAEPLWRKENTQSQETWSQLCCSAAMWSWSKALFSVPPTLCLSYLIKLQGLCRVCQYCTRNNGCLILKRSPDSTVIQILITVLNHMLFFMLIYFPFPPAVPHLLLMYSTSFPHPVNEDHVNTV